MKKKLITTILFWVLIIFSIFPEILKYHSVLEKDNTIYLDVDWSFDHFVDSSLGYDNELAKTAIVLSREIYVSNESLKEVVDELGYTDLWIDDKENNDVSNPIVAFAYKRNEGINNFLVVIRGTGSFSDVLTDIRAISDHFQSSMENTMERFIWYIEEILGIDKDTLKQENNKFFVTGHSMGAAVANLMSYSLEEFADKNDIFSYCFSCPSVGVENGEDVTNALNIISDNDPVPLVPYPIGRYGKDIVFSPESVSQWIYGVITDRDLWDICGFTIINKWNNHRLDIYFSYVLSRSLGMFKE